MQFSLKRPLRRILQRYPRELAKDRVEMRVCSPVKFRCGHEKLVAPCTCMPHCNNNGV